MRTLPFFASLLLVIVALAGCAMPGSIVPGQATADELLQKLGKPTATRIDPQGGESWEYVYGPAGTETWRFGIDRNRRVSSATQLLTHERLYQVVPGVTTEAQVRELLGPPREIYSFREEKAWEWNADMSPNTGVFVVRFGPDGRATGVNVLMDFLHDGQDMDAP